MKRWLMPVALALVAVACKQAGAPVAAQSTVRSAASAAKPQPSPPRQHDVELHELMTRHCTRCHDANHRIDLTRPPPVGDVETWSALREAVLAGEMPPPTPDAPFPLDPAIRREFVRRISRLLASGQRQDLHDHVDIIRPSTWLATATRAATPYLKADEVAAIVRRHRGGVGGLRLTEDDAVVPLDPDNLVEGLGQFNKNLISHEVCRAIVNGEATVTAAKRVVFHGPPLERAGTLDAARLSDAEAAALTCDLSRHIYQEECTSADRSRGVQLFRTFQPKTGSTNMTLVAVCTAYLSGLRLIVELPQKTRASGAP